MRYGGPNHGTPCVNISDTLFPNGCGAYMEDLEREQLQKSFSGYANGRFNEVANLNIIVVGFCLATLSAQKIPACINMVVVFIVFSATVIFSFRERGPRDYPLRKMLDELKEKYRNSKEIVREIDS